MWCQDLLLGGGEQLVSDSRLTRFKWNSEFCLFLLRIVDHDVLITKLSWYGVSDADWFVSYLCGHRQVVRGGRLILPMSCGIPQGSILGPILFIVFTNDVYGFLTHGRLLTYADDTVHIDCAPPNETGLTELQSRLQQTMCELKA